MGWRLLRHAMRPLDGAEWESDALLGALRALVANWSLRPGTRACFVLPPQILGVMPAQASALDPGEDPLARLPYPASEVASTAWSGGGGRIDAVLWIHRDWMREFESIAATLNLRLEEIYARGQLLSEAAPHPVCGALVEAGEGGELFLHLYGASGRFPLRSALLEGTQPERRVLAELLGAQGGGPDSVSLTLCASVPQLIAERLSGAGIRVAPADDPDIVALSGKLIGRDDEGIWLVPPPAEVMRGFVAGAVGIGVLGLAGFAAMLWHEDQLSGTAARQKAELREQHPRLLELQVREREAREAAALVRVVDQVKEHPSVLLPLGALAQVLPQGAWISRFTADAQGFRVEGHGASSDVVSGLMSRLPWVGQVQVQAQAGTSGETGALSGDVSPRSPDFIVAARWSREEGDGATPSSPSGNARSGQ